jgi:hypothetical protein
MALIIFFGADSNLGFISELDSLPLSRAVRIKVTLDKTTHEAVLALMHLGVVVLKKEVVERAIQAAACTIFKVD